MIILSLDTSTEVSSIFLSDKDKILASISSIQHQSQLRWLMPSIERLFRKAKLKYKDIDALAVGRGPGGYTGLRIGIITAKTMSQVLNLPIYGFNSLDILSFNALKEKELICPVNDARRGQLYTALYETDTKFTSRISSYSAVTAQELCGNINKQRRDIVFLGTGIKKYLDIFKKNLQINYKVLPEHLWYPEAFWMAYNIIHKKARAMKYFDILPFYLRKPDIHIKKAS